MADRIATTVELRSVLTIAAAAGILDVRVEVRTVRETYHVAEAVTDLEIRRVVTDVLRSDSNPEVVFTLGGGQIVAQAHVPADGLYSIGDELWRVESDLSGLHGGKVWLTPATGNAYGYGIVTAYRMPAGDYSPVDWPLVERFGVEHGKFQQSAQRMAA